EGLGSCTLIATDKTGTLTCNELTVRQIRLPDGATFDVSGEGFAPVGAIRAIEPDADTPAHRTDIQTLATAAVLCNEGDLHERGDRWVWRGDPTDVALLTMAHKAGVRR